MREIVGFAALYAETDSLPDVGWIYLAKGLDPVSPAALAEATFFLAETEDEEIAADEEFDTWLEAPVFAGVVGLLRDHRPRVDAALALQGAIHYYEYDDFLE